MPLYDYDCLSCGRIFELRQSFDSAPEGVCPTCQGQGRRKFHAVPIIYKGSGFYTTDYKHTGYSPPSGSEDGHNSKNGESKQEDSHKAKSGESKQEDSHKAKSGESKQEAGSEATASKSSSAAEKSE